MSHRVFVVSVAAALIVSACAEPPSKEMDQAQGAIDAARAAGGEQYASASYAAAVDALRRSEEAAGTGDYRLALDNALTSREQAQNAAREAADTKARLRGEAERLTADITARLAMARTSVDGAQRARIPQRAIRERQQQVASIEKDVQKAGAAIEAGDYLAAKPLLDGAKERIDQLLADIDAQSTSQATRRAR